MTLKAGFFHVYPPHIGGPFRGLSEAVAAIEHHRASLAATSGAEASPARSPAAEASPAPSPAAESSLAPSPAAEPSLDPQPAVEVCLAPSAAEEASLDPQPAVEASLARPSAGEEAFLDPQPAVQACLTRPPAAEEASHAPPPPAVEASLSPSPAAEASSNPPTYDWRAEEREKGRQLKLYLSQLDPDECLRSVKATLAMWKNHPKKDNKPAEQPVMQSWIGRAAEQFKSTTTDPAILQARYRFERFMEEKETKKNGMKWMQKEALRAYENYKSADKNLEYELVMIHSQCLIYDTFSKSYHHYNFTMRTRRSRLKHWNYQQYFAESKSVEGKTQYFCIPLQPNEHGHCFGCRKVGVSLRHPENGGYEKGNSGSGFPFDTDESAD
ncbi:uncharacterized protein LOC123443406 isoform X2 [Hordeum vulgare subsp. vulgare]|uniref:uncharacterized protein LOC123443406 isoform X2 n=1 Tax=Hordeum vulgare subsp. vulgare TaxID=112509 RepID=UPI001D1A4542|nr:uncharacterized protein LOC123443406 isoform X2 [Hordeum vulgare subsp. vulgare]